MVGGWGAKDGRLKSCTSFDCKLQCHLGTKKTTFFDLASESLAKYVSFSVSFV